jgi:hypothetical protein
VENPCGKTCEEPVRLTVAAFACSLSGAMRSLLTPLGFATFAALGILGCLPTTDQTSSSGGTTASSSGGTTDSGADGGVSQAGQACLDTADAYAAAAMRCGGDPVVEKKTFINNLANGDCNSVAIRDEAQLRSGCIPSFATISCDALTNQRFDPTCAEQLIRSK